MLSKDVLICVGIVASSIKKNVIIRQFLPQNDDRFVYKFLLGDNQVANVPDELIVPISSDGNPNSKHCSCTQKTRWWFSYALENWPHAKFYAKTEDDAYINFEKLLYDLNYLNPDTRFVYGLMNFINDETFVGDFEHGNIHQTKNKKPSYPFPTGPLAVFSKRLAHDLFVTCNYIPTPQNTKTGRRCNLPKTSILVNRTCDGMLGLLMGKCVKTNITVASMTWTKGHHNALTGGGLGWVRPGPESVVVHYLKSLNTAIWKTAQDQSMRSNKTIFPPILYNFNPLTESINRFSALSSKLQTWYNKICNRPHGHQLVQGGNNRTWHRFGCHEVRGYNLDFLRKSYDKLPNNG